jgi:hypothetical protein
MDVDRRQHPRTRVQDVSARIKSSIPVRVVDISQGGVQLELTGALKPASECKVTLPTSWGERELVARVCRCRAQSVSTDEGMKMVYRAGLEFIDPSDEDLLAIAAGLEAGAPSSDASDEADLAALAEAI